MKRGNISVVYCIGIVTICFLLFSCKKAEAPCNDTPEDVSHNPGLIGTWKIDMATLDNTNDQTRYDWSMSELLISPLGLDQLILDWRNIPEKRKIIFNDLDTMDIRGHYYSVISPVSHKYYSRPVEGPNYMVPFEITDCKLKISLTRIPRKYSYDGECPSEELALLCSVQGKWTFDLTLIK